jgi:hypothetical protein
MNRNIASNSAGLSSPAEEVRRVFTTADNTVIYFGEVTYRGDFVRIDVNLRPQIFAARPSAKRCGWLIRRHPSDACRSRGALVNGLVFQ